MTKEARRLASLVADLDAGPEQDTPKKRLARPRKAVTIDPNPPKGEKGEFFKMTITMSPDIFELVNAEALRRKVSRAGNATTSAIIREALISFIGPQH